MLVVKQLHVSYLPNVYVLTDVNLTFEAGFHVVTGMGKTTLLQLLAGLNNTYSGQIMYEDAPLKKMNRERYRSQVVGLGLSEFGLVETHTVAENLQERLAIGKVKWKARQEKMAEALGLVEVETGVLNTAVKELPLETREAVALAVAMVHGPRILLIDEPSLRWVPSLKQYAAAALGRCVIVTAKNLDGFTQEMIHFLKRPEESRGNNE